MNHFTCCTWHNEAQTFARAIHLQWSDQRACFQGPQRCPVHCTWQVGCPVWMAWHRSAEAQYQPEHKVSCHFIPTKNYWTYIAQIFCALAISDGVVHVVLVNVTASGITPRFAIHRQGEVDAALGWLLRFFAINVQRAIAHSSSIPVCIGIKLCVKVCGFIDIGKLQYSNAYMQSSKDFAFVLSAWSLAFVKAFADFFWAFTSKRWDFFRSLVQKQTGVKQQILYCRVSLSGERPRWYAHET